MRAEPDDGHLRRRHHDAGQLHRAADAELDGQRANPQPAISFDRLEIVQGHDPCAPRLYRIASVITRASGRPAATTPPLEPRQAFIPEADRGIAPPAVLFQPEGRRRVNPGERQTDDGSVENPLTEKHDPDQRSDRPDARRCKTPWPGILPEGYGRSGLLMASTSRSYQSLTAWLVSQIKGPASATPRQRLSGAQGRIARLEAATPTAHMGANHVIGLSSSRTAAGLGIRMGLSVGPRLHSVDQSDTVVDGLLRSQVPAGAV